MAVGGGRGRHAKPHGRHSFPSPPPPPPRHSLLLSPRTQGRPHQLPPLGQLHHLPHPTKLLGALMGLGGSHWLPGDVQGRHHQTWPKCAACTHPKWKLYTSGPVGGELVGAYTGRWGGGRGAGCLSAHVKRARASTAPTLSIQWHCSPGARTAATHTCPHGAVQQTGAHRSTRGG